MTNSVRLWMDRTTWQIHQMVQRIFNNLNFPCTKELASMYCIFQAHTYMRTCFFLQMLRIWKENLSWAWKHISVLYNFQMHERISKHSHSNCFCYASSHIGNHNGGTSTSAQLRHTCNYLVTFLCNSALGSRTRSQFEVKENEILIVFFKWPDGTRV